MTAIPFNISGQTAGRESVQFSAELTRNVYLDISETTQRKGMHDFPGLKAFSVCDGADRGWHVMSGVLYKLCGDSLNRVDKAGVYTQIGLIPGISRAVFADDGITLYIVADGRLYKMASGVISAVSQSVVTNPQSIAYINRQFILTGDNGLFGTSEVADGDSYPGLNFEEAATKPDSLVRVYIFSQIVYMLGEETTELWYNSGVGSPPFDRQDTSLVNVGIAGRYAVTNTDSFLYWLGDDRKVYQCVGASARNVATPGIAHTLEGLGSVSDCICSSFVYEGQDFILFSFPMADKTILFSETFNYWVVLASDTSEPGGRWYGSEVVRAYDKNLVSDYRSGNVYELDKSTYTDAGDTRLRVRTLPVFSGLMLRKPGLRITVSHIRVSMEVGVGLIDGQGNLPLIFAQFSPDGGNTWQREVQVSFGRLGEYAIPVDIYDFSTGYDIRCRIKCSDPVYLSMFDGVVEIKEAGY